jgi:hypothetical protein
MQPWLTVTEIGDVVPLTAQIGVDKKICVPDALHKPLFGANGDGPPCGTFAIMDGARVPLLAERLAASGLAHRCLFKGEAFDNLQDVAPWIVALTDDNDLTRRLFTRSGQAADLWDASPALFVRSDATLDALWRHFRKFTRIRDTRDDWFYFRFWDYPVSTALLGLGQLDTAAPLVAPLFDHAPDITLILRSGLGPWLHLSAARDSLPLTRAVLTDGARDLLRRLRQIIAFDDVAAVAIRTTATPTDRDAMDRLRALRDGWLAQGFWRKDHLVRLCCWELMLGPRFAETWQGGRVRAILAAPTSAHDRIVAVTALVDDVATGRGHAA